MGNLFSFATISMTRLTSEGLHRYHSMTGGTAIYSERVLDAIRNNDYIVGKPLINNEDLRKGSRETKGHIYVGQSSKRPGEVKIGFTTMNLRVREKKFRIRYGYDDFRITDHASTAKPRKLESLVTAQFRSLRTSGNTNGDANEWYRCSPSDVKRVIDIVAKENKLPINSRTWSQPRP